MSSATPPLSDVEATLQTLQREVHSLEGRLANRDPSLVKKVTQENTELEKRFELLKKVLLAMILESYQARNEDEFKLQYEVLRLAAVEYFKKTNIDPELWKSIAS